MVAVKAEKGLKLHSHNAICFPNICLLPLFTANIHISQANHLQSGLFARLMCILATKKEAARPCFSSHRRAALSVNQTQPSAYQPSIQTFCSPAFYTNLLLTSLLRTSLLRTLHTLRTAAVSPHVEDLGPGHVAANGSGVVLDDGLGYLAFGIVEVAKDAGTGDAGANAGRLWL